MARNAEKARSMLNRWAELRKEEKFGRLYVPCFVWADALRQAAVAVACTGARHGLRVSGC